jgi:PAS domain S-box-containing protein
MIASSLLSPPRLRPAALKSGVSHQPTFRGENGHAPEYAVEVEGLGHADDEVTLRTPVVVLHQQDERLNRAMLDSIADVVAVVNRGGAILFHNRAVRRVFGYRRDELVGSSVFELIHEEDLPQFYSAFFNVIEGFIEYAATHFRHRACDGTYRAIAGTVGILRDVPFAGVVCTFRPIVDPSRVDR